MNGRASVTTILLLAALSLPALGRASVKPPRDLPGYYLRANAPQLINRYETAKGPFAWPGIVELSELSPANLKLLTHRLHTDHLTSRKAALLRWAIGHIRRRAGAEPRIRRRQRWAVNTFVGSYRKVGVRNPKWDAPAQAAIRMYAINTALWGGHGFTPDAVYHMRVDCHRAIQAGCQDPLVAFLHGWQWEQQVANGMAFMRRCMPVQTDLERLLASRYPLPVKFAALYSQTAALRSRNITITVGGTTDPMINHPTRGNLQRLLTYLPAVVCDPKTPDIFFAPRLLVMRGWLHKRLHWSWRQINHQLTDAFAHNPKRLAYFKPLMEALMWKNIGWHARGNGWANTVSPKEQTVFSTDERRALRLLEADVKHHLGHAVVWQGLVDVGVGAQVPQGTEMSRFLRAMRIDPSYFPTVPEITWYMQRRWYGTSQGETELASFLMFHGYWRAGIPQAGLGELIHAVAARNPNASSSALTDRALTWPAWHRPQAWELLKIEYSQYLRRHPDDVWARAIYMHAAKVLHHWHVVLREAQAEKAALNSFPAIAVEGESRATISQTLWHAPPQILDTFANQARRHLGAPQRK